MPNIFLCLIIQYKCLFLIILWKLLLINFQGKIVLVAMGLSAQEVNKFVIYYVWHWIILTWACRRGDFRYKGKVVVDTAPTFDVDEFTNDQAKLISLVDDGNRIPHDTKLNNTRASLNLLGMRLNVEEEIDPWQARQLNMKSPYYFFDLKKTQTTHWGMPKPLTLSELS